MNDYELDSLIGLIKKLVPVPKTGYPLLVHYVRLKSLYVYFQYAVASVRTQEENIQKMAGGQHKNFETHDEYEDCLLKIYSNAISTYSHMRTCLKFSKAVLDGLSKSELTAELTNFRAKNLEWAESMINKRDRIAAHPEEENRIVYKPDHWIDNGQVGFTAINTSDLDSSIKIILEPRKDLEILREYLAQLSVGLTGAWKLDGYSV